MKLRESENIGHIIVRRGLITESQLETALGEQMKSGRHIADIIEHLGYLAEDEFYKAIAAEFGTRYVDLGRMEIDHLTIAKVPSKFASHYKLIPVEHDESSITVATANPALMHVFDDLGMILKKPIKTVVAKEKDIVDAIKKYYGVGAETVDRMAPSAFKGRAEAVSTHTAEDVISSAEDATIIKLVNQFLLEAYRDRATDIHIEPYEDELKIRSRIDGVMYDTKVPPDIKRLQAAIISRIKIMSNLDIAERRLPQDGRTKIRIGDQEADLRISILPTPFGESVVIRVLPANVFYSLEKLGLAERDLEIFERLIKAPHGIIFVTGPTGSGKTTTLYACLKDIDDSSKKILTIEDPIENQMKGVVQMQVHPKINLTFSQGLRSMLRHDPDIMMVGEVRDYETAEITIRVALTGHLVFSTLHTNDAAGGIARLIDMGIEPYLVASSVNAFIAQRLVRVICPRCKRAVIASREILREFGMKADSQVPKIYEGVGCEDCKGTGYKGRTAIYEIMEVTEPVREMILKKLSSDQIKKKALSLGMRTLRQDGWTKILAGITTPYEVLRVTQEEKTVE